MNTWLHQMYEQDLMGKRDNYYAASWFVQFTKFKRLQLVSRFGRCGSEMQIMTYAG